MFNDENMEPERLSEAPENGGIDPGTMRVSKWYQGTTREDDDSHFSSSSRVSDVFTGTNRTSYQGREPIEDDEEILAMREENCILRCPSEFPIRELETIEQYTNFIRTRTRCMVLPLMTFTHKHGLIIADLSSHNK